MRKTVLAVMIYY